MKDERKAVDLVFVLGPTRGRSKRAISRYIRRVSQTSNGVKVASVYFKANYDPNLGNTTFLSRIIDFTDPTHCKISEQPQVQGNPLQHVTKLSFRHDAVKICFLLTNTLPFNDSYNGDDTRQQDSENNDQSSEKSSTKQEEIYHEDPLLTCRHLAAMGVAMYCIEERNYCAAFCREIYAAFTYITGGQLILLDNITSLHKTLQNIITEEISMENQVGQVRDYLCVAWHSWGRRKAVVPANIEVLTDNILNHFYDRNIMTHEVLVGGDAPDKPSELAKEIAKASEVSEARNISSSQENWSAELNWIAEEHDEVIPGYNFPHPKKEMTDVSVSEFKLVTRNQVSRLLTRVLSRRPQKQLSQHSLPCASDSNEENHSQDGTTQSNGSPVTSHHKVDNNNNKLLEEAVLKTNEACKTHESMVISCQKMTLCSIV